MVSLQQNGMNTEFYYFNNTLQPPLLYSTPQWYQPWGIHQVCAWHVKYIFTVAVCAKYFAVQMNLWEQCVMPIPCAQDHV